MKIGLYGLPCAGKTTLMNQVKDLKKISGGEELHRMACETFSDDFENLSEENKAFLRAKLADALKNGDNYIIDGHCFFGKTPAMSGRDAAVYDVYMYLYTDPSIIRERMEASEKNRKWADYDIDTWQSAEIEKLRKFCHENNRDFYVISDGGVRFNSFMKEIRSGFSSMKKGIEIADDILTHTEGKNIVISDGDKTLSGKDTEYLFTKKSTSVFDGNFYTGYQTWLHSMEREKLDFDLNVIPIRQSVLDALSVGNGAVVSSGPEDVWWEIGRRFHIPVYTGREVSAETKYFTVKKLKETGKIVTAYGDSMSDYYMLQEADEGILFAEGRLSRSLEGRDLHEFYIERGNVK